MKIELCEKEIKNIITALSFYSNIDVCVETDNETDLEFIELAQKLNKETGMVANDNAYIFDGILENPAQCKMIEGFVRKGKS